jgi:hypothetical protein
MPRHHPSIPVSAHYPQRPTGSSTYVDVMRGLWRGRRVSEWQYSLCQYPTPTTNPSNPLLWLYTRFKEIWVCLFIFTLFIVFLSLSLFFGIFYTVNARFGHSMGDAFSLASYISGIGAFISTLLQLCHLRYCTCWRRGRVRRCQE